MTPVNIEDTVLADYYSASVAFSKNTITYVFSPGSLNLETYLELIYYYIYSLHSSKIICIENNLYIDCAHIKYEPIPIQVYEKNKFNITSVAIHNSRILLYKDKPIYANSIFNIFYGNQIEYFNDNALLVYFNFDLFSPFLPINPKTFKYDPESKYPNPDWEHNTKIMYEILEYPLSILNL